MSIFDKAAQAEKVRKLPKWAQQIIERQQATINGLRKEVERLVRQADPDDEIILESYHRTDDALPAQLALPNGFLRLNLGLDRYGRRHDIHLNVETDYTGRKCVRLSGTNGPMRVLPVASNTITISTLHEKHED